MPQTGHWIGLMLDQKLQEKLEDVTLLGPDRSHLGEVFTNALPAMDPVLYGHANLTPKGSFVARSHQTFRLTYVAGRYGLDDTGSIRVVFRFSADGGPLQMDDPQGLNFVTARSSSGVPLRLSFNANGSQRPWYQALTVMVSKGYLREGETIEIVIGDPAQGSPGYRLQSFCESAFTFKVLADVCATGHYVPVADSPTISIVPGAPEHWKVVLPGLRRPGETFRLGIKAEDAHGNPSDLVEADLRLESSGEIAGLPAQVTMKRGQRALVLDGLACHGEGEVRVKLLSDQGKLLAESNPLQIREGVLAAYWADMHGQSGESVGINTARQYFEFARNLAFLDAASHQANDFQVNNAFWAHINDLTAEFHEDGRFLTLPGYEWSGNTGVGGDRNVYFRQEGRAIRRSSHALLEDRSGIDSDAPTARALFEALAEEDCLIYAHIGGRPADVAYAHDPRLETAMEIHSAWGTFEWLMADCFAEGYRVGVVANSDGHKGRPGASYPGASDFGAYGGLTCFLMPALTRDDLFACLKARRHYATTGDRIVIDLTVTADQPFDRYAIDPKVTASESEQASQLSMGDIAASKADKVTVTCRVSARAPIERIELLNTMEKLEEAVNPTGLEEGDRLRVLWRGALAKGRGAKARWRGRAWLEDCRLKDMREINAWNPDRKLTLEEDGSLTWESVTAGNFGAMDLWLEEGPEARIRLSNDFLQETVKLADVDREGLTLPAGGMDLEMKLTRLPAQLQPGPLEAQFEVSLKDNGDNPLWIRVTTEDGFQAWTSPVYLFRD